MTASSMTSADVNASSSSANVQSIARSLSKACSLIQRGYFQDLIRGVSGTAPSLPVVGPRLSFVIAAGSFRAVRQRVVTADDDEGHVAIGHSVVTAVA